MTNALPGLEPLTTSEIARTPRLPAAALAPRPGESFADVLNRQATAAGTPEDQKKEARKAAGDLVANALILPVFKQIRRSVFAQNTIFSGGIGEKAFGPEFDMQIADRIAHSPRLGVTDALAERLLRRGHPAPRVSRKPGEGLSEDATRSAGVDVHG